MDDPLEQELFALLGLRLTLRQWDMLYLLLDHPLLSDLDLATFLELKRKSVRALVYGLHRLGCIEAILNDAGTRWCLSERGMRLTAAANHFNLRNLTVVSGDDATTGTTILRQRGVDGHLQQIQHTVGIYHFFALLAEAARRVRGHTLCWWETGAQCERRYQVGEQWNNQRPDAFAEYRVGQQWFRFWLEWNRGTMNARDLDVKFTSYAHYIAVREGAKEDMKMPELIYVAQEQRIQRVVCKRLSCTSGLVVWTTTAVSLYAHGPLVPIWSPIRPQFGGPVQVSDLQRQSLFDEHR